MIAEVKIPEVGESITEGVLAAWYKKNGDLVQSGEDLFELETDKVTMSVPAEVPGKLEVLAEEGNTVKVGQVVGQIDTSAAKDRHLPSEPAVALPEVPAQAKRPEAGEGGTPLSPPAGIQQAKAKLESGDQIPLSPAVRRLVEENNLDPEKISGTGKDGRITKEDVQAHLKSAGGGKQLVPTTPAPVETGRETRVKMSPLRHRITERLVQVQQTAAILTTFNEVDMSRVMAFRSKHKDKFQEKFDVRLGFMSFFVKASVDALKTVPQLNARIENDEIVYQHYYDIGVAVSTEQGLVVPVVRDADRLSFAEVEKQIADYAQRARDRKLTLPELTGGCFTISNGGIYGSLLSTPILNPPQSGILGMHRIQKRAVVVDDQIVARPMMYLAMSYDHRIVDGAGAVTFLKRIVECLEDPERMLLEV